MKKIALLFLAVVSLTGCWTSIFTVAPTVEPVAPVKTVYSTTVTTPTPKHTTVTTVTVTNYNSDPCFSLDLNAVAAAFAESRSVREFEEFLNSSRYMINNLDLNHDGWIDYLRVIETHRGYYHTFLIQACLDYGVFQDVATLIAERRSNALYVEVVYIVRPVFVKRPPLWDVFGRSAYAAWSSPYYYDYYPSYYTRPKPVYLNHYQAYVNTYMTNHHYCHHCDYPTVVFYSDYTTMTRSNSRNDYATQHPNDSFEQRVTRTASSTNGVSVRNAGQLRSEVNKAAAKEETKNTTTSSRTSASTSTSASSTSGASARSTSSSSTSSTNRTPASTSSTTKSDKATTAPTSSRSTSATAASSTTATTSTSGKSTRSTQTATPQRQPSTTIQTKVNKSGTTRTTVKTTDASGRTTTVKRESSSTRSSSSSATRSSSSSATRSSGSSARSSQGSSSESSPRSSQRAR